MCRTRPISSAWAASPAQIDDIKGARVLGLFGDKITTDHISPAGSIKAASPAGKYLIDHGVGVADFNQYGTRRGNHEVMMRGTFANIRIRNHMLGENGKEGGYTIHYPSKEEMSIYDAAMQYKAEGVPLVIFAGVEYGNGSSRDWAAKGTNLLGVRAVIAQSFERIHRSNLVGMGIVPFVFEEGTSWASLGLKGDESVTIEGLETIRPRQKMIGQGDLWRRHGEERSDPLPHRYARRTRLLQERRHPAVRAARSGGLIETLRENLPLRQRRKGWRPARKFHRNVTSACSGSLASIPAHEKPDRRRNRIAHEQTALVEDGGGRSGGLRRAFLRRRHPEAQGRGRTVHQPGLQFMPARRQGAG